MNNKRFKATFRKCRWHQLTGLPIGSIDDDLTYIDTRGRIQHIIISARVHIYVVSTQYYITLMYAHKYIKCERGFICRRRLLDI